VASRTRNRIAADDNPVVLETIPFMAGIGVEDPLEGDDFTALLPLTCATWREAGP
jgi:hypothetical protein